MTKQNFRASWFRWEALVKAAPTPSGQETGWAYSITLGIYWGLNV